MKKIQFIDLHCYNCKKFLARAHLTSTEKKIDIATFCNECSPFKNPSPNIIDQVGALPVPQKTKDEIKNAILNGISTETTGIPKNLRTNSLTLTVKPTPPTEKEVNDLLDAMNWRKFLTENGL